MSHPDRNPEAPPATSPNDSRYWDERDLEQELLRTFQICHECRMCVNYCGSFPELFDRVDRDVDAGRAEGSELINDEDIRVVSEECWQCKLCYIKCPYTPDEDAKEMLDFPRLMAREKAVRAKRNGITFTDKVLGEPQLIGELGGGVFAPATNLINENRLLRKVTEKVTGISAEFPLPPVADEPFPKWLRKRKPSRDAGEAGEVVLFATCYGNFNTPEVPRAAVAVLEHLGYRVNAVEETCCGMPNLDGGDVAGAVEKIRTNVAQLIDHVRSGAKVLVPSPTCGYTMKREWTELVDEPEVHEVAEATVDLMEFFDELRRAKDLPKAENSLGKVAYHGACHLRAQKIGFPGARVLTREAPDTEVRIVQQCSAVDGTWGMKANHYETGRKYAGKLVREIGEADNDMVVTDCPLSALRINKENQVEALHPVQALAKAYGLKTSIPSVSAAPWLAPVMEAPSENDPQEADMKPVERSEILSLGDYEDVRDDFRARVIGQKKHRRVPIGEHMTAVFENHDTVLLQIQEMLRTEKITREAGVAHELETYNELVPGDDQLSMTLFIEIPDKDHREKMLTDLAGMEEKVALEIDGEGHPAKAGPREGADPSRTTAVQYYLIDLPREAAAKLRDGRASKVAVVVSHPAYETRAELGAETVAQLSGDLAEA